jgi:hypothetical protein
MKKPYILPLVAFMFFLPGLFGQTICRETASTSYPDSVITWKFDSEGDSVLNVKMTYRYDNQLHVIESDKFTREQSLQLWEPNRRDCMEYDNHNRRIMRAIYNWDYNSSAYAGFMKETYQFDNNGNPVDYHYYTWNSELFDWMNYSWEMFFYDNQDKITRTDHFKWNAEVMLWDTASYDIYDYGDDGLLEHLTIYEPDVELGGEIYPGERGDYQYDGSDNLVEIIYQIYNPNTELWYFTGRYQYWYDDDNRKSRWIYAEYNESDEIWIEKEKEDWGWDDSDSLILYAYYRIGEDSSTWFPHLKVEMTYNSFGKMTHYRSYSGNDLAQWVPNYERHYDYLSDTLITSDSLFQWEINEETWNIVDCHNYCYDSLLRTLTDSYYKWQVHTAQLELSTRGFYFYSGTAAIEEHHPDAMVIFPNPTHGKFQITSHVLRAQPEGTEHQTNSKFQIQNRKIEVLDIFGNILETRNPEPVTLNPELDISCQPAGVYLVRIYLENKMMVKKIIKL